jgi:glycosyltransferase involved in cell wall biosynthesis
MAKILFLTDSLSSGGAERQMSLLLKYLHPPWMTRVVSFDRGPYYQVLLSQNTSVAVYDRHRRFDLLPVMQLYSEILRYKPDIIHSWGGLTSALVAPLCRILRITLIDGTIRMGGGDKRYYWRMRTAFWLSDHIIANSYAGLSEYHAPLKKSSVIYNGMDPDRLKLIKQRPHERGNAVKVIMTGRISPQKDFSSFFDAARILNADEPGCWKFVAVGSGNEEKRKIFNRSVEDLVAAGVVELPQAEMEVLPYLEDVNIGVLLTASIHREGFSNSIMEYMACEIPVICTDSGGNKELVLDGETGFVIPPGDVNALVDRLLFLKSDPDKACQMGKAGKRRMISLCSIEKMISDYEELYSSLLMKRNKGTPRTS